VRRRVLARTGHRLALDRRARSAEAVQELFEIWHMNGTTEQLQ
jgi:hypothetical protein